MANTLDFTINLNDLLSAKLDKINVKLDGVNNKISEIGQKGKSGFNSINESAQNMGNTLSKIEGIVKGLAATFVAFKAFEFIKDSIGEYRELNNQQFMFNQQLKNSGIYSEELVKNLTARREQLNSLGFVDDVDQIKMQRDLLKNYSGSNSSFQNDYQTATADIAASKGTDLTGAGSMLDKALRGAAKGLNELLGRDQMVEYQKAFKLMQKQGLDADTARLEAIKKIYAGQAVLRLNNDPQLQLDVAIDELSDTVRDKLGPLFVELIKKITPLVRQLGEFVNTHMVQITKTLKFVSDLLIAIGLKLIATNIIEGLNSLRLALIGLTAASLTISGVVAIIASIGFVLYEFYQNSENFKKGIDELWNQLQGAWEKFTSAMNGLADVIDRIIHPEKNKPGQSIFKYNLTETDEQMNASQYRQAYRPELAGIKDTLSKLGNTDIDVLKLSKDEAVAAITALKENKPGQDIVDAINKVRGIAPAAKNGLSSPGGKSGAVPPKSGAASEDVTSKVTGQSVTHINFNYTGDMVRFGTIEIRSNTSDEGAEELANKVQNIVMNAIAQGLDAGQRTAGTNE